MVEIVEPESAIVDETNETGRSAVAYGFDDLHADRDELTDVLRRLRLDLTVAFGLRSFEDRKLPGDVLQGLDELEDIAGHMRELLCQVQARLGAW